MVLKGEEVIGTGVVCSDADGDDGDSVGVGVVDDECDRAVWGNNFWDNDDSGGSDERLVSFSSRQIPSKGT
jgi:hypothetical protein